MQIHQTWAIAQMPRCPHILRQYVALGAIGLFVIISHGGCSTVSRCEPGFSANRVFTVVPAHKIAARHCNDVRRWTDGQAMMFPSVPGYDAEPFSFLAHDLLCESGVIADGGVDFCVVCREAYDSKCAVRGHAFIHVEASAKHSKDVKFAADAAAVGQIRKLCWHQFRALRDRFQQWLVKQPANRSGCRDARCRTFNPSRYDEAICGFWQEALSTARLERQTDPIRRWAPSRSRVSTSNDLGMQMGAVPLMPGMRLIIAWGGTAIYPLDDDVRSRQTVTGISQVDVVRRDGGVRLALPPFVGGERDGVDVTRSSAGAFSEQPWFLDSEVPFAGNIEESNRLPFGDSQSLAKYFVPVHNELDFRHIDVLRLVSTQGVIPETSRKVAPHITLLVPIEFIKADFPRRAGRPYASPTYTTHSTLTHNGEDAPISMRLARCYMLWGTQQPFTSPEDRTTGFGPPNLPGKNRSRFSPEWAYSAVVLPNQSSVSIRIPVSINGNPLFVPLGYTWGDVIEQYLPLVLPKRSAYSSAPVLRIVRTQHKHDENPTSSEYHLHDIPIDALMGVEVVPGDAFFGGNGLP